MLRDGKAVGEHPDRTVIGTRAGVPAPGACAGHPNRIGQSALGDLVGEHLLGHRRATDVAGANH
jgi:hypothetical protein